MNYYPISSTLILYIQSKIKIKIKNKKIMREIQYSRINESIKKRPKIFILVILAISIFAFYFTSESYLEYHNFLSYRPYLTEDVNFSDYLVQGPNCHIISLNPMDPSIKKYVKKMKYEKCSIAPLLSSIVREINGTFSLVINSTIAKKYKKLICCWSSIVRPKPSKSLIDEVDSTISASHCEDFESKILLPLDIETVMVSCRNAESIKKRKAEILYENIHAIVNPMKMEKITEPTNYQSNNDRNKMSILILGVDSISRLNFLRSLPKTEKYLRDTNWFSLNGYNKIGDNTFPNLMAILTGLNNTRSYTKCNPKKAYKLDKCPFIWYAYKNAGYTTAYGEDFGPYGTFNYLKIGFIQPPTDYYLRPYVLATEKFLKSKIKFDTKYCTGPESAVTRVLDYAVNFAKTFVDRPYFGFFWVNAVSHNDVNGISSMDDYFFNYFMDLESHGTFNNTIVIFLSDHGMRWGSLRQTHIGWYEERLPFIYLRLPPKYRDNPEIFQALKVNGHQLTSPYDLYETLRDVLIQSGGKANSSESCSTCQSLFRPVPVTRSCEDAGISSHWCTCTSFKPKNVTNEIAHLGANTFLQHVENIIKNYKNSNGKRLCAKLKLKKIYTVSKIIKFNDNTSTDPHETYFYLLETMPGGAIFEMTVYIHPNGTAKMTDDEVSRLNSYSKDSVCLKNGNKKYCHCII